MMTVAEFQSGLSEALDDVRNGETIILSDGLSHRGIAAVVPCSELTEKHPRPLGLLKSRARVTFSGEFSLDDEQFLNA